MAICIYYRLPLVTLTDPVQACIKSNFPKFPTKVAELHYNIIYKNRCLSV